MWKKGISVVLISALTLSAATACHKKDNNGNGGNGGSEPSSAAILPVSGEEIEDDSKWFDVQTLRLADLYDRNTYEYAWMDLIGFKDGNYIVLFEGQRKMSAAAADDDSPAPAYDSTREERVDIIDISGNITRSIDVNSILDEAGIDTEYGYISSTTYENDTIVFTAAQYDPDTWDATYTEIRADGVTGEIIDCHEVENTEDSGSYEGSYSFDGYTVAKNFFWDDSPYYILDVTTPDGASYSLDLRDEITQDDIFDIPNLIYIGGGKAIAPYVSGGCGSAVDNGCLMFDFEGRHAELYEEDMSWLGNADIENCVCTEDGSVMSVGREGLYQIDFDAKTVSLVVDFNCANLNRFDAISYTFLGVDDGKYLFSGTYDGENDDDPFSYTPTIVTFELADSNPNAGKTYIRVAAPEGVTYEEAEAVRRFNDVSDDGFIVFDFSYDSANQDGGCDPIFERITDEDLEQSASMSNTLSIDLMTGDGPDMIFGMIGYSQLDNDNYLMDLSDLIPSDGYFSNVFDAARVDGNLYQVPLDCGFAGITADGADVGFTDAGFTFESYGEFVDEVCNGSDPIGLGRMDYMALCYSAMSDVFNSGSGTIDYDNEEFRALAEFVRNIPEEENEEMLYDVCESPTEGIGYRAIYSLEDYLYTFGGTSDTTRLMGIPTYDGRGPLIKVSDSVGISACTQSADICREFVEFLLSYDGQMIFSDGGRTPVHVQAFEDGANETIDTYNAEVQEILQFSTREELAECGFFAEEVDASVIDAYEGFIRSASTIEMSDPSVTRIIREELPAYFEGQKTLDEVIEILEDRVQTFVNERG